MNHKVTKAEKKEMLELKKLCEEQEIEILKNKADERLYVPPTNYVPDDLDYSSFELSMKHDYYHLSKDGNEWKDLSKNETNN